VCARRISSRALHVLAEGIEGHTQLNQLRELGCPLGQGFLFARPLPVAEAELHLGGSGGIAAPIRDQAA
jgi:EAL domain-containing protein (putative c-di-GMP-specific phosphodiesterase class I)